ncbi:MAG: Rieske 2Fe-2S domain-containing protein [Thermoplasmata archaeon]
MSKVPRRALVGADADEGPLVRANLGESIGAIEGERPYLDASLAEGTLTGRRLTCVLHGAPLDVCNGAIVVGPCGIEPPRD